MRVDGGRDAHAQARLQALASPVQGHAQGKVAAQRKAHHEQRQLRGKLLRGFYRLQHLGEAGGMEQALVEPVAVAVVAHVEAEHRVPGGMQGGGHAVEVVALVAALPAVDEYHECLGTGLGREVAGESCRLALLVAHLEDMAAGEGAKIDAALAPEPLGRAFGGEDGLRKGTAQAKWRRERRSAGHGQHSRPQGALPTPSSASSAGSSPSEWRLSSSQGWKPGLR